MSEKVKYYMDEHVHSAVINGLRRRGVDVLTTPEAGMIAASDLAHLRFAANEERVVFTQDNDFLKLHAEGIPHTGIVYTHQTTPIGEIVKTLMLIYNVLDAEDMVGNLEFV